MKSIKQQYIDLTEGRMSQTNFMRNLRMTMPQYVTNVTSFKDAVRILKNKGILSEAKTKLTADQANPSELRMGIRVEMEHTDDPKKAEKIALDHLAENPFYYTQLKLSGVDTKALPSKEKKAIAKKKDETEFVDKDNQMKPVKGIEKIKASANKAKKETNKPAKGVSSMSLVSKTVRGVKKMDPTGEKMKTIKEAEEPKEEPKKPVHQSIFDRNARLTTNLTKLGKGEKITSPGEEEDTKASNAENKLREAIRKMIQKEIYDGRDNMTDVAGHQLNEAKLFADYSVKSDNNSIESRFARSISETLHLLEYFGMENRDITIDELFDEGEMSNVQDGDDFYAGPTESLKFFQTLPNKFIVTNNIDNVEESFKITKTGSDTFTAKEI